MTRHRIQAILALVAATALALTGCSTPNQPGERTQDVHAEKTGTGERRTDLAPLQARFPLLGEPLSAVWYSGTMGSGAPGPTTYWIDAVITVTPATAAAIESSYNLAPTSDTPDVVDALRDDVPTGLQSSPALNTALPQGGTNSFTVIAYYSPGTQKVVLTALGGN